VELAPGALAEREHVVEVAPSSRVRTNCQHFGRAHDGLHVEDDLARLTLGAMETAALPGSSSRRANRFVHEKARRSTRT